MNRDLEITDDPVLSNAVRALLTAFVSIELSPGTGVVGSAGSAADAVIAASSSSTPQNSSRQPDSHLNSSDSQTDTGNNSSSSSGSTATDTQTAAVGFEEKFHYRRPMYACLRYWYGKPLYDVQFKVRTNESFEVLESDVHRYFV